MKIDPEDRSTIKELLYPDTVHEPVQSKSTCIDYGLSKEDNCHTLSRAIWVSNPGYIPQQGVESVSKMDFIWDQKEVDHMKSVGLLDKTFNRRRDAVTKYMEVEARQKALSKNYSA
eukprot:g5523.t1